MCSLNMLTMPIPHDSFLYRQSPYKFISIVLIIFKTFLNFKVITTLPEFCATIQLHLGSREWEDIIRIIQHFKRVLVSKFDLCLHTEINQDVKSWKMYLVKVLGVNILLNCTLTSRMFYISNSKFLCTEKQRQSK